MKTLSSLKINLAMKENDWVKLKSYIIVWIFKLLLQDVWLEDMTTRRHGQFLIEQLTKVFSILVYLRTKAAFLTFWTKF